MDAPTRLRIEHGPRGLGVGVARPRLSWWLPHGSTGQLAYRIEAAINAAEPTVVQVTSDASVLRPWPFAPLVSRSLVVWRVQVRTEKGWSGWSSSEQFEVGLLDRRDWEGSFIGMAGDGTALGERGHRGAVHLRRRFVVDDPPRSARLRATALGIYELHLDGTRVGDLELTPGFTAYRSTLEAQTYDVTDLVGPGEHELVATLTDGWYRGSVGFTREECSYGNQLALLAQLEISTDGGSRITIATDGAWDATAVSPIVAADLIEGERVDLRVEFPPVDGWTDAVEVPVGDEVAISSSPAPPTRAVETYVPLRIDRLTDDRQIIALPSNINGWVRVDGTKLGPDGNAVLLTYGEALSDDGDVDMRHLEVRDFMTQEPLGHGQVDEVISAGPESPDFEPRHTTHGFQFARVDGADDLDVEDATGVMVQTDLVRTGWFRCSDPRVNDLHEAAVLSFRGNACEIPTDCPQRERAGWTGDWQLFAPTAAFLYDVAGFTDRWLRDLAADQWPDGRVTNHVPDPVGPAGRDNVVASFLTGSAGWGDAATLVPYAMWEAYDDLDLLRRQYPSMVAWVEFALRTAEAQRHPTREAARPVPLPHERYLWDAGFHWGEWCEPDVDGMEVFTGRADQGHVATAYLKRSLGVLATVARLVGNDAEAERYDDLGSKVRGAWQAEFVDVDGLVQPATQANLTRALAFDLVDDDLRPRVLADLVAVIEAAGDHVGTGFLTTPFLLPTLADEGRLDVAYRLLVQETPPSWLAMIAAGATTIWENWEGIAAGGEGSLNHYSKGAVITFLHRYVAGIRPVGGEPGYRHFEIRPQPGGGIDWAEATLDSPYGRIRSAWSLAGDDFSLDVDVPPGTTATAILPDGDEVALGPGHHERRATVDGSLTT